MRDGSEADLDHAARRRELHRRRQPRRVAEVGVPHRLRSVRRARAAPDHLRRRRPRAVRSCTARRSPRWSCPTAIPSPLHGWKNAFDAGEWGLGRMTQPLTLGCDCLGEIHYFDATLANEQGKPWVIPNAICMHEEDYGILWKHVDLLGRPQRGAAQPPARRQLHRDRRQLRVRLLLVLLPRRQHPARGEAHRHRVADGDRAGHAARVRERDRATASPRRTTSTCSTRGSTSTSTAPVNEVYEVDAERMPPGPDNPWLNAFRAASRRGSRPSSTRAATPTPRARARGASRTRTRATGSGSRRRTSSCRRCRRRRCSRIPTRRSAGAPASRSTTSGSRRTRPTSGARAGEYPNQHAGGDGLPALDRAGPRRSPTPTSSSGTRSASRTSCGPRTGRSCRSSTPASR